MGLSVGLILCAVSALLFLLTMSLEAAAAAGDNPGRPKNGDILTKVLPAFALTGSVVGVIVAVLGVLLHFTGMFNSAKHLRFLWFFFGLLVFWFLGGATGMWSAWRKASSGRARYDLWEACLAFEIISSIVWLCTLAYVSGGEELTKQ